MRRFPRCRKIATQTENKLPWDGQIVGACPPRGGRRARLLIGELSCEWKAAAGLGGTMCSCKAKGKRGITHPRLGLPQQDTEVRDGKLHIVQFGEFLSDVPVLINCDANKVMSKMKVAPGMCMKTKVKRQNVHRHLGPFWRNRPNSAHQSCLLDDNNLIFARSRLETTLNSASFRVQPSESTAHQPGAGRLPSSRRSPAAWQSR